MVLTVGEVSGLIAAGVFVLQVSLPLLIPFLLLAFLTDVNSVLTWAALGRYLQSSLWPSILGTSTAAADGVQPRVTYTQWMQTGLLAVVSIASICTPLGLRDSIELAASSAPQKFGYLEDASPFGTGTPDRSTGPFTRFCGTDQACPGQTVNQSCEKIGLLDSCAYTYESRMPVDLLRLYNDGATAFSPTVSSIFDMQYRNYINATDTASTLGWYIMPTYRHLSVLLLEGPDIRVVEGLVVDGQDGGIGFRNHTAPVATLPYGARWTEDLLFIEPETQCVPLNLTVDFERPSSREVVYTTTNTVLTDHGGLSQLSRTPPNLTVAEENGQEFDLRERAYQAAWLNNFLTMAYFNATDPDPSDIRRMDVRKGQSFDLPRTATNLSIGYWNIRTSVSLGEYLDLMVNRDGKNKSSLVNPHGVNSEDFFYAANLCGGSSASSTPNLNSTVIGCSIVYGAATRTDSGSDLIVQPGSKWSMPLYTCATALKAVIKTVTFQRNGTTNDLSTLHATSITPKTYTAASPPPTWGVESLPGQTLTWARPTWGIVGADADPTLLTKYNLSTTQAETLYLPGWVDEFSILRGLNAVPKLYGQNLPGVDFYTQTLQRALSVYQQPSTPYGDYSGYTSMALYTKWQGLSRSAGGVASIINLIWTDLSANAVVGTRGWGLRAVASEKGFPPVASGDGQRPGGSGTEQEGEMVPVTVYERKIRYRIPFAIPAFVVAGMTLGIVVGLVALVVMRRTGVTRLRGFLEKTSVGRLLALLLLSETGETRETSWMEAVRTTKVRMTGETVVVEGEEERLLAGEVK